MSYKVVRDAQGRCRACGPDDNNFDPAVPPGGSVSSSNVWVPIDPTPTEQAVLDRAATDEAERAALKLNNQLMTFVNMTPAQIDAWCDANVTSLATARDALKLLAKIVNVAIRRQIRDA